MVEFAQLIGNKVNELENPEKAILTNQYLKPSKNRISRRQFCTDNQISLSEYIMLREIALLNFYEKISISF